MKRHLALIIVFIGTQLFAQENNEHLSATIIGSGSPKYNTERSGPSVLISYKNTQVLVDMGNGTQANLDKNNTKIRGIDGLLFTHHHLDHNEEFVPIFIKSLLGDNNIIIAGPKPTSTLVNNTLNVYEEDINYRLSKSGRKLKDVEDNFTSKNLNGNESFYIGDIKISCIQVNHTITTLAYRFEVGNESIVISGDLTYSENLPILARNADYLIMDSGGAIKLGSKRKLKINNNSKNKQHAHVNLTESSQMAKEANVKNLVLTHFSFTNVDEEATSTEINKQYNGTIIYAKDLMTLPLSEISFTEENPNLNYSNPIINTSEKNNLNNRPSFSIILKKMDINNDGKISKTEAKGKLKENFDRLDVNKDNYITENETTIIKR